MSNISARIIVHFFHMSIVLDKRWENTFHGMYTWFSGFNCCLGCSVSKLHCYFESQLFYFLCSFLILGLRRQWVATHRAMQPTWETWEEVLAPGLCLPQPPVVHIWEAICISSVVLSGSFLSEHSFMVLTTFLCLFVKYLLNLDLASWLRGDQLF